MFSSLVVDNFISVLVLFFLFLPLFLACTVLYQSLIQIMHLYRIVPVLNVGYTVLSFLMLVVSMF